MHAHELGSGRAEFCEHGEVTDGDVAGLRSAIADRVLRLLRRVGKWPTTGEAADSDDDATDLMLELGAAAVQGRTALGERAGELDARVGRGTRREPFVKGALCADVDGFSLHAAVRRGDDLADAHVRALVTAPNLRRLWLEADEGSLTAASTDALGKLSALEELRLCGVLGLQQQDYLALARLPSLRVLDVSAPWYLRKGPSASEHAAPADDKNAVGDAFVAAAARLPRLRVLGLGARRLVSDAGQVHLRGTALEELDLHQCSRITAAGLRALPASIRVLDVHECAALTALPDHLHELRRLDARFNASLGGDVTAALRHCTHLRSTCRTARSSART